MMGQVGLGSERPPRDKSDGGPGAVNREPRRQHESPQDMCAVLPIALTGAVFTPPFTQGAGSPCSAFFGGPYCGDGRVRAPFTGRKSSARGSQHGRARTSPQARCSVVGFRCGSRRRNARGSHIGSGQSGLLREIRGAFVTLFRRPTSGALSPPPQETGATGGPFWDSSSARFSTGWSTSGCSCTTSPVEFQDPAGRPHGYAASRRLSRSAR